MDTTRYELPSQGTSLLGYIVRRLHKTEWLSPVGELVARGDCTQALERVAVFTAASSTSYGRAYYRPEFNRKGDTFSEPDPATGAAITAHLESDSPHYRIAYEVFMPNGDTFQGNEEITGTTVGWRGLGMPAPSLFSFTSASYLAELTGVITSELAPALRGGTRIRAYGFLNLKDNAGNSGKLDLNRQGMLKMDVNGQLLEYDLPRLEKIQP